MKNTSQKVLRVLTDKELNLIANDENILYKGIIRFLALTGLRISELISLNVKDIFVIEDNNISLAKDSIKIIGKGQKERSISLNKSSIEAAKLLVEHTHKYCEIDILTPLIISQKGSRISSRQIQRIFMNIRQKYNIECKLTPHVLRHQCATYQIEKGIPLPVVSAFLGHSSFSTTVDVYTHPTRRQLLKASQIIDDMFDFNEELIR